jgi:hypothetical protein
VTGVWITIGALALGTTALKLAGPLLLGGRLLPAGVMGVVGLLASVLLAALIIVETFGQGRSLTLRRYLEELKEAEGISGGRAEMVQELCERLF